MPHINPHVLLNILKKHLEELYDIYTESVNNSISDKLLKQIEKLRLVIMKLEDTYGFEQNMIE